MNPSSKQVIQIRKSDAGADGKQSLEIQPESTTSNTIQH